MSEQPMTAAGGITTPDTCPTCGHEVVVRSDPFDGTSYYEPVEADAVAPWREALRRDADALLIAYRYIDDEKLTPEDLGVLGVIRHALAENKALLVAAVNALPALLDIADAARAYLDTSPAQTGRVSEERLRAALARLAGEEER